VIKEMREELELKLVDKFPNFFRDYKGGPAKTCMAWGITCGDGWYDILYDVIKIITILDPDVYAAQIKEKFGSLRIYLHHSDVEKSTEQAEQIIRLGEKLSKFTCEECGADGKLQKFGGLWKTVCEKCSEPYLVRNK
jgi:hypothetical protein